MALTDDRDEVREQETAYEPPRAEDIETAHTPAEVAAGLNAVGNSGGGAVQGVEESERWH